MGLALLSVVSCLRTFGNERAIFWRESASGINIFAFFVASILGNIFYIALQCTLYASVYYYIARPPAHFLTYFWPCLLVSANGGSWGYLLSTVVPPKSATLAGVVFILISCGLFGEPYYID